MQQKISQIYKERLYFVITLLLTACFYTAPAYGASVAKKLLVKGSEAKATVAWIQARFAEHHFDLTFAYEKTLKKPHPFTIHYSRYPNKQLVCSQITPCMFIKPATWFLDLHFWQTPTDNQLNMSCNEGVLQILAQEEVQVLIKEEISQEEDLYKTLYKTLFGQTVYTYTDPQTVISHPFTHDLLKAFALYELGQCLVCKETPPINELKDATTIDKAKLLLEAHKDAYSTPSFQFNNQEFDHEQIIAEIILAFSRNQARKADEVVVQLGSPEIIRAAATFYKLLSTDKYHNAKGNRFSGTPSAHERYRYFMKALTDLPYKT